VPAAWNSDGISGSATYAPVSDTPHLFAVSGTSSQQVPLGNRKFSHVAHPSGKVMLFEEFDRFTDKSGLYFAYPDAKPNLAFFDGSVRSELTADANPGWNPDQPGQNWLQTYIPIDTFPEPRGGLEDNTRYCQRFRWTRYGLQGIDYGGQDIGRKRYGLDSDPVCAQ